MFDKAYRLRQSCPQPEIHLDGQIALFFTFCLCKYLRPIHCDHKYNIHTWQIFLPNNPHNGLEQRKNNYSACNFVDHRMLLS